VLGFLIQLNWLLSHDWNELSTRLPLGFVLGGLLFWLVGELLAVIFRLAGKDFWGLLPRFISSLKKPGVIFAYSSVFLIFAGGIVYGWRAHSDKIFPYDFVQAIQEFLFEDEGFTVFEKLANDLDIKPHRLMVEYRLKSANGYDFRELEGLTLSPKRKKPLIFLSPQAAKGYRLIQGAFCFPNKRFGVILLDQDGKVAHTWEISQDDKPWDGEPDTNVFPHGLGVLPDGSLLTGYDSGSTLEKYDWCGNLIWRLQGRFDHSIVFEGDSAFWIWNTGDAGKASGYIMDKISADTGKILKSINMQQVMDANPGIDIFGVRQFDGATESTWIETGGGQWHPNDIEPLSEGLARYYPEFQAGDLLISMRSLNLVFVLDQNTLKVKWWRLGAARRQHDPDWNRRGTITIFDNNMNRGHSNIVELWPTTYKSKILLAGSKYDFYSSIRGKHQLLPNGDILVTSTQQGRVFEVDQDGKITFDFVNIYEKGKNLLVSEAILLPLDYFGDLPSCGAAN
jgi:hypothetical protein